MPTVRALQQWTLPDVVIPDPEPVSKFSELLLPPFENFGYPIEPRPVGLRWFRQELQTPPVMFGENGVLFVRTKREIDREEYLNIERLLTVIREWGESVSENDPEYDNDPIGITLGGSEDSSVS